MVSFLMLGPCLVLIGVVIITSRKVEWRPGLVSEGRSAVLAGSALVFLGTIALAVVVWGMATDWGGK
jgi:hypothetical protein